MALPEDFNKIYGSTATGGLTPIGDVNYAKGWEFVGSNPPTKNDFSYLQNLSDLKSQWLYSNKLQRTDPFGDIKADGAAAIATALANLGLGVAAKLNVGTTSGTVAAGDDSRIIGAMQKSNNGSDIENKSTFLNNIGITSGASWFSVAGYIIQWGINPQPGNTTFNISFPIPFPIACLNVVITRISNEYSPTGSVFNTTSTGFTLKQADNGNGGSFWLAIGN